MEIDLFGGDDGGAGPRPAWQIIDAAARLQLTGELVLDLDPPVAVYLRDGHVYFAERATDGSLGVRLLVDGLLTYEQLRRGVVTVRGVEHLGRLFERVPAVDRTAVEVWVEHSTHHLLAEVAERVVGKYRLTLYTRHVSGLDRWWTRRDMPVDAAPETTLDATEPMAVPQGARRSVPSVRPRHGRGSTPAPPAETAVDAAAVDLVPASPTAPTPPAPAPPTTTPLPATPVLAAPTIRIAPRAAPAQVLPAPIAPTAPPVPIVPAPMPPPAREVPTASPRPNPPTISRIDAAPPDPPSSAPGSPAGLRLLPHTAAAMRPADPTPVQTVADTEVATTIAAEVAAAVRRALGADDHAGAGTPSAPANCVDTSAPPTHVDESA